MDLEIEKNGDVRKLNLGGRERRNIHPGFYWLNKHIYF